MEMIKINELFDIKYGNSLELISLTQYDKSDHDSVNFVSRTEKNNGVSAVVRRIPGLEPFDAGLITVAGSGNSVLESFIQTSPFYTGFHVFVLRPLKPMSELEKLFYCYCIRQNQYKYNFGRQANKTLKEILVPRKMPQDWQKLDIKKLNTLNKKRVNDHHMILNVTSWHYFNLVDLFQVSSSKDELIEELTPGGKTPYVTSSDKLNGVTSYVKEVPTNQACTMTANRGGSVGYFYYQPFPYKATPVDVRILTPRFKINGYIALFIKTILQQEKYRYNYSRKMGSGRLSQFKMKLLQKMVCLTGILWNNTSNLYHIQRALNKLNST
jgi:hypothetical protein